MAEADEIVLLAALASGLLGVDGLQLVTALRARDPEDSVHVSFPLGLVEWGTPTRLTRV